jgi:hypothetical protein
LTIGGRWAGGCESAETWPLTPRCRTTPNCASTTRRRPTNSSTANSTAWRSGAPAPTSAWADDAFGVLIPPDSTPAWDGEQLLYRQAAAQAFATDGHTLTVPAHHGGRLDWYSVAAEASAVAPAPNPVTHVAVPTNLHYPGAPADRWWQIEDAEADVGGYAPDSAHTATAVLADLIFSHGNDWFLFPVTARAGHVVTIATMTVLDVFGRNYHSDDRTAAGDWRWPGLQPPSDWTLFQIDGLPANALLLWHVAELPLGSGPVERVQFGLDEEANLLWAVERIVDGREVASRPVDVPDDTTHPRFNAGLPTGDAHAARAYAYVPGQGAAPFWHPYQIDEVDGVRRLVQRRLVDLSRQRPLPLPSPQAELLQPAAEGTLHRIAPRAVPSNGVEVERRWQLARDMDGNPVLWLQRQRVALLSPPARRLRFDVMEDSAEIE